MKRDEAFASSEGTSMQLRDDQVDRYSRQIILSEIGGRGQKALLASSVALVGDGPLACTTALYLTAAGVGQLDIVVPPGSNASQLRRELRDLNPDCISTIRELSEAVLDLSWLNDRRVVIETTRDEATTSLLNATALRARVPFIAGSALGARGWFAVFAGHEANVPCALCQRHEPALRPSTADSHPLAAAAAGVVGSLLALAVLKLCLRTEVRNLGMWTRYDGERSIVESGRYIKQQECTACGKALGSA